MTEKGRAKLNWGPECTRTRRILWVLVHSGLVLKLNHLQKPCQMKNLDVLRIPKKKNFGKWISGKKVIGCRS
jgi:hypothetical protein